MRVYEVIKDCTVSYREEIIANNGGACMSNDFVLYVGDFIFIESAGWNLTENGRYYREVNKLKSIYHNKLVDIKGTHIWTWINELNIIDPKIDKKLDPEDACIVSPIYGKPKLKDVTQMWSRDKKLEEIGI